MKMNLNRRFFLKKLIVSIVFILYFFNKKNIYILKKNSNKDLELLKNFYFAKKKISQTNYRFNFYKFSK